MSFLKTEQQIDEDLDRLNKIYLSMGGSVIRRNGVDLVKPKDALRLLDKIQEADYEICGADAFRLIPIKKGFWFKKRIEMYIQPSIEDSEDYSDLPKEEAWEKARKHMLKYMDSDFYFEIL